MGLLDDAIREHLDLKRRRGADPAEIQRAEQEALGPVRREPIGSEEGADAALGTSPDEGAGPVAVEDPAPPAAGYAPATGDTFGDELPSEDDGEEWDDFDEAYQEDDDLENGHPEPGPDAAVRPAAAPAPPPASAPEPLPPDPDDSLGDTADYELPPTTSPPADADKEDVLEETPEFLQDTPDHDRLWFEQRPPRDFDFDE